MKELAEIVLLLAHVVDFKSCAAMPLIIPRNGLDHLSTFVTATTKNLSRRGLISLEEVFHNTIEYLSSTAIDTVVDAQRHSSRLSGFLFLCSNFG